jgi:hypothetical protein
MFENCKKCDLSKCRKNVVEPYIQRSKVGKVDVMFITSSPTPSGNILGTAISYQDSKVYREMLRDVLDQLPSDVEEIGFAVIPLVLCATPFINYRPSPPNHYQVLSCAFNFFHWVKEISPMSVIFASEEAKRYLKKEYPNAKAIVDPALVMLQGIRSSSWFVHNVKICLEVLK